MRNLTRKLAQHAMLRGVPEDRLSALQQIVRALPTSWCLYGQTASCAHICAICAIFRDWSYSDTSEERWDSILRLPEASPQQLERRRILNDCNGFQLIMRRSLHHDVGFYLKGHRNADNQTVAFRSLATGPSTWSLRTYVTGSLTFHLSWTRTMEQAYGTVTIKDPGTNADILRLYERPSGPYIAYLSHRRGSPRIQDMHFPAPEHSITAL